MIVRPRLSKFLIIIGLSVIVIVTSICIGIRNHLALEEPLYFRYLVEHYLPTVADSVLETSTIELMYLTEISDKRKIIKVSFVGHPELNVEVLGSVTDLSSYGIYSKRTVTLYLDWDSYASGISDEVKEVNTLNVEYSDQSSQLVDIGRICIYGGNPSENLLEAIGALPLFRTKRIQKYEAKAKLKVVGFSDTSMELMNDFYIMDYASINEQDYRCVTLDQPILIQPFNLLEFKMELKISEEQEIIGLDSPYDFYEIEPKLIFYDEDGNEHFVPVQNSPKWIDFNNYFDVRKYLIGRGIY